jgi:uncharacterized protein (TIGR00661 family)
MMKILYAIQGTGNGHIARATDLIPEFKKYGDVDVLLSGQHCELHLPFDVKYRLQGLGFFFGRNGGVDIIKTWKKNKVGKFFREVARLPVEEYDIVISDFEPVSAWACRLKGKKCFGMSHQSAVTDPIAAKPDGGSWWGKAILEYYAPVTKSIGFHFNRLNGNISTPVIRKPIRKIIPEDHGYFTVYLPAYSDTHIISVLSELGNVKWQVFSKRANVPYSFNNISVRPVDNQAFVKSLSNCSGVLCNAGFETPAETLFLGKKLCVIPMKHQYEQACNAAMLKTMGIPVLQKLSSSELTKLKDWTAYKERVLVNYPDNASGVVEQMLTLAESYETTNLKKKLPRLVGAFGI